MSNGDLIRSMTDEELAAVLPCPNEMGLAEIDCPRTDLCDCGVCLLRWLKEEKMEVNLE